ncbi:hypothetical protein HK405_014462, partial [Cladochytrium tenue]
VVRTVAQSKKHNVILFANVERVPMERVNSAQAHVRAEAPLYRVVFERSAATFATRPCD